MYKTRCLMRLYLAGALAFSTPLFASDYLIDTDDAHAFILFKVSHLGYSWLLGQFNTFEGRFSYDHDDPAAAQVEVTIQTRSIDSNHAERDKHLRGEDFLYVDKYPEARFISTVYRENTDGSGVLQGELTLRGVTRAIRIEVEPIGAGMDPWGGYRRGFEGRTALRLEDFGIDFNLGPGAETVYLELYVEGIRQRTPIGRKKR